MNQQLQQQTGIPVKAIDKDGRVFWWTGKAGEAFVSPNRADAFVGFNVEGARRVASRHNANTALHGLRFIAVTAEAEGGAQ